MIFFVIIVYIIIYHCYIKSLITMYYLRKIILHMYYDMLPCQFKYIKTYELLHLLIGVTIHH